MAIPSRPPGRAIPQIYGDISQTDLNEVFRRLSELASTVEGRRGPITFKDSGEFLTDLRNTILKMKGKGDRATGSISFSGVTESSMFLAKGAYQTDTGAWIATETAPVILELRGDTPSPRIYRNVGLDVGAEFTPNPVGWIAVGDSTGAAVSIGPSAEQVLQSRHPLPHTHTIGDVIGSRPEEVLQPRHPTPHTHDAVDLYNVVSVEATGAPGSALSLGDIILATQIFGF